MNTEQLKKLTIQAMILSLIGASIVSVTAVLAGNFNDTFGRALFTLALVAFHALASLVYIDQTSKTSENKLRFFNNAVFIVIVLSFVTSILGVWEVLAPEIIAKLYGTYFIALFASLHGDTLAQTLGKESKIDKIVYTNYVLMGVVIVLILPLIWFAGYDFGSFYFRLLAASGIVDGTLTVLAVIYYRLYIQKHPEAKSTIFSVVTTQMGQEGQPITVQAQVQKRRIHPLIWLLGIYIVGQFVISALFALVGAFYRGN